MGHQSGKNGWSRERCRTMQNIAMDGRNVTSNHILLYPHTHFRRSTRTTSTSTTYITTYHQQHPPPCPPPCPPPPSPTHQPHHSRHWSSKASGEKNSPFSNWQHQHQEEVTELRRKSQRGRRLWQGLSEGLAASSTRGAGLWQAFFSGSLLKSTTIHQRSRTMTR